MLAVFSANKFRTNIVSTYEKRVGTYEKHESWIYI